MIIFSHTLTPRLQYVVNFLSAYYNTPIRIAFDEEKYQLDKDPHKINYSYHRVSADEIWIHSHVLLFETAVRPVRVECFDNKTTNGADQYKAFFKAEGDFKFDIFAGIFYLITRYEEYLPHKQDAHGRYAHENSLAFREGFLHVPLINIWLKDFHHFLLQRFPDLKISLPGFQYLPTYDIDMAWSFLNKGFKRNAGALIKSLFTGRWGTLSRRISVLRRRRTDPFDAYEWMDMLHDRYKVHPVYFFLVAQQTGKYDKNIDVNNEEFRQLIRKLAARYRTGLHPSWASGDQAQLLSKEKSTLEHIVDHPIHQSRQHFIRFELPLSYRRLIALGITDDYSMGYGGINGFRASIASSYNWYDLKNEVATPLVIHPFCFMESTSFFVHGHSAEDAYQEMMHYLDVTKANNGTMITIWHNSSLGTDPQFEGWREVYERFVASAAS